MRLPISSSLAKPSLARLDASSTRRKSRFSCNEHATVPSPNGRVVRPSILKKQRIAAASLLCVVLLAYSTGMCFGQAESKQPSGVGTAQDVNSSHPKRSVAPPYAVRSLKTVPTS